MTEPLIDQFTRTRMLWGQEALDRLACSHVLVFGVGGVGGYAAEAIARSGVGHITLVDNDTVSITNLNRQIIALHSTVGQFKVDVMRQRILDINPDCQVKALRMFYLPENADEIDLGVYDYVVDCIDTVAAKIDIIRRCHELGVPVLSSMGAANKMDPTAFRVIDISKTHTDPLAKAMRAKLRQMGIHHVKVVFSDETPMKTLDAAESPQHGKRHIPASNAFVPAAAGLVCASEVVKDLIQPCLDV